MAKFVERDQSQLYLLPVDMRSGFLTTICRTSSWKR